MRAPSLVANQFRGARAASAIVSTRMNMTSGIVEFASYQAKKNLIAAFLGTCCFLACAQAQQAKPTHKQPLDYVNGLVGTAPLDKQELIGNAPPPGERLYSGMTLPGAVLPHGSVILGPINRNVDLTYGAGVPDTYFYPSQTMMGFSTGAGPTVMPVVGDWTVPPERSASIYDRASEKSSPGYYSVYLGDFRTKVEMTAATWAGMFRFTFPQSEKAHVLLDVGRSVGTIEIVGSDTVRGQITRGKRGHSRDDLLRRRVFKAVQELLASSSKFRRRARAASSGSKDDNRMREQRAETMRERICNSPPRLVSKCWCGLPRGRVMPREERLRAETADWNFDRLRKRGRSLGKETEPD